MITTTETTALASNTSTPTRRASWKDNANTNARAHLKQQHSYDASTPFLTEKNHSHPLSSPPSYSANPAQRSLADIEAQGTHYVPTPKRSRFTTIVLCALLITALCALGTWMIWDGNWIGATRQRLEELKSEGLDMEATVRGMKAAAEGMKQYMEELRAAMSSAGGEFASGTGAEMDVSGQEWQEGMSMEGWEM